MPRIAKLTDIHLVLLASAAQRDNGSLLPLPNTLGASAERIRKAVTMLIKRGLAQECEVATSVDAWRQEDDHHIGVAITEAGRAAIATDSTSDPSISDGSEILPADMDHADPAPSLTKAATVIAMLESDAGANLAELVSATGWLPHTTRAALTGLRKKGYAIQGTKEGKTTRYRIEKAA